ncbi:hypothetical protein V6R21_25735 [Limibacter armeniacum]|uniref:hypothetical protein n=1 Tax=Limibacter armeniacum TaxID=466084 RepID=UPI002FE57E1D
MKLKILLLSTLIAFGFTGCKDTKNDTERAADRVSESARETGDEVEDMSSDAYNRGSEMMDDATTRGKEMVDDASERASEMADDAEDMTNKAADKARSEAEDSWNATTSTVRGTASEMSMESVNSSLAEIAKKSGFDLSASNITSDTPLSEICSGGTAWQQLHNMLTQEMGIPKEKVDSQWSSFRTVGDVTSFIQSAKE